MPDPSVALRSGSPEKKPTPKAPNAINIVQPKAKKGGSMKIDVKVHSLHIGVPQPKKIQPYRKAE